MQSNYSTLDDEDLQSLWEQHRKNLAVIEMQAAQYGMNVPLPTINELSHAKEKMEGIRVELDRRGVSPTGGDPLKDIGRQLYRHIPLDLYQRELLAQLVAADRAVLRDERRPFIDASSHDGEKIIHKGFPEGGLKVPRIDMQLLVKAGLLMSIPTSRGDSNFTITPQGMAYVDYMLQIDGQV